MEVSLDRKISVSSKAKESFYQAQRDQQRVRPFYGLAFDRLN